MKYEIKLKEGIDTLNFGDTTAVIKEVLGSPNEIESLDNEMEEEMDTILWHYDELGLTVFFEEEEVMTCLETDNENSTLFGKKVFGMAEKDLIKLMEDNGFKDYETEEEAWGERRVSFDEAMVDFYFVEGKLTTIDWGVYIEDEEEEE